MKALLPGPDSLRLESLLSAESQVIVYLQDVLYVFVGVIVCLWVFMCGLCIVYVVYILYVYMCGVVCVQRVCVCCMYSVHAVLCIRVYVVCVLEMCAARFFPVDREYREPSCRFLCPSSLCY